MDSSLVHSLHKVKSDPLSRYANFVRQSLEELDNEEEIRISKGGNRRTKVLPVQKESQPLLSHGLLMSYAMAFEGGQLLDHYQFIPDFIRNIGVL